MSIELLEQIHGSILNMTPKAIYETGKEFARQQAEKLFHQERLFALTTKSENPWHDMWRIVVRMI
jgi:hypothetical protein